MNFIKKNVKIIEIIHIPHPRKTKILKLSLQSILAKTRLVSLNQVKFVNFDLERKIYNSKSIIYLKILELET